MELIKYKVVEQVQFQDAIKFYNEQFLRYDPGYRCLKCYTESAKLEKRTLGWLEEGLSYCAVNTATEEMIGLRLAHSVVIKEIPEKTPTFEEYLKLGWSKGMAYSLVHEDALFDAEKILEKYQVTKLLKFLRTLRP